MKGSTQKLVWGSAIGALLLLSAPARGQEPVTVLVLDRNAIDANVAPNFFPAVDINRTIADVGVRDALPFFNAREGQRISLPGGTTGHEGWLAFTAVPAGWAADGDGLENFVYAGPGLGSPDAAGNRTSQLNARPEIVPLGPVGLGLLTGRTVCAVAFSGELPRSADGVSLSGASLGIVAFSVAGVSGGDASTLPTIDVDVLETRQACSGPLTPMADASAFGL